MKDCSICKYCDEDFIFDVYIGVEYPIYFCEIWYDTSLDFECNNFE